MTKYARIGERSAHRVIVERALGRSLRGRELVHHVDENPLNNAHTNLVICPDDSYHHLLHRRTRAYRACGNANAYKCRHCKKWDLPGENGMVIYRRGDTHAVRAGHKLCYRKVQNEYYAIKIGRRPRQNTGRPRMVDTL